MTIAYKSTSSIIRNDIRIVPKLWGHEEWLVNNDLYAGKRLVINKGFSGSLHHHEIKTETYFLDTGRLKLELNGETETITPGTSITIYPNMKHAFTAYEDSVIIEFSTYHSDSDVYRHREAKAGPIIYGVDVDGTLEGAGGVVGHDDLIDKNFIIISSRSRKRSREICDRLGVTPIDYISCRVMGRAEEMRYVDSLFPMYQTIYVGDAVTDRSEAIRAGWRFMSPEDFKNIKTETV